MKKLLFCLLLFLAKCTNSTNPLFSVNTDNKRLTCVMNGFKGFPNSVSGEVGLELKSLVTIIVLNKDESEMIEMTFPKEKCNAK